MRVVNGWAKKSTVACDTTLAYSNVTIIGIIDIVFIMFLKNLICLIIFEFLELRSD